MYVYMAMGFYNLLSLEREMMLIMKCFHVLNFQNQVNSGACRSDDKWTSGNGAQTFPHNSTVIPWNFP